jgi:hypothetical protein
MITFASLILALVVGVHPVEVLVADEVARVEIRLDGEVVGVLEGEPWALLCDFGPELEPHLLEARALDSSGRELGWAQQWINVPRRSAEAGIVLDQGGEGEGAIAHLTWDSLSGHEPQAVDVTFDGTPLVVESPHEIRIPPFDQDQIHFLRVEIQFPGGSEAVVETTFGGIYADQVNTELTAVPIVVDQPKKLPTGGEMEGWFVDGDQPLQVLAVDRGSSEIVVVRDLEAQIDLEQMTSDFLRQRRSYSNNRLSRPPTNRDLLRAAATLEQDQRLRFISSFSQRYEREGYGLRLFPPSPDFSRQDGGLLWLLNRSKPPLLPLGEQRLAEAMAAAAISAAMQNRRRAVVLIIGDKVSDSSQLAPNQVRGYLSSLRVPLAVWTTGGEIGSDSAWGPATSISSLGRLEKAFSDVKRELGSQRIVWLEGIHLPQSIALSAAAKGIRLAE